ncbi:MAG: glycosyl transferase [Leptospira sp.]|nr:glycosyl transferase [Leptospira sp.]
MGLNIYYYISGHGFGHISRSSTLVQRMVETQFIDKVHVVSSRIQFLEIKSPKLKFRDVSLDVGVAQKDSLSIDLSQTKLELQNLEKSKEQRINEETKYIRENKINFILTDSASLPITIALEAGIPSIFLGNFTWDFIYKNYAKYDSYFSDLSEKLEVEYCFATEALVLPFSCPMPQFLEKTNVGLVGRRPKVTKRKAREKFSLNEDLTYILLSFGAYGLEGKNFETKNLPDTIKLVAYGVPGLSNPDILIPKVDHYPDLVTAVDFVCTKPGYGILSECFFANTPILYTDRGDFAEYPYLVSALKKSFRSIYMNQSQIISCQFKETLASFECTDFANLNTDFSTEGEQEIINRLLEYTNE